MTEKPFLKLKCLIIDDEEPAHEVLRYFIAKIPWFEYSGSCYNVIKASEMITVVRPDVIFLDISMPEISGMELFKIKNFEAGAIVMTTAHAEYAVDGFTHDVTSFLLKPIDFDRFLKVAVKLRTVWEQKIRLLEKSDPNSPGSTGLTQDEGHIWIKAQKKLLCRRFKEIYAIEGCGDYVKIYCADEVITSRCTLGSILEKLPPSIFVKTHRSYIVNRQAIKQIDGKMITTLNDIRLPITSKSEHHEIIQQIIS